MEPTDLIADNAGLSQQLKSILAKAKFVTFFDISRRTIGTLRKKVPGFTVRHLANLEHELKLRGLDFYPDQSIRLDEFINQRKLFLLWKKGVTTYPELDRLSYEEFESALGGQFSRFFRKKNLSRAWMAKHKLTEKELVRFTYLTPKTAKLLYQGGLSSLEETVKKSDYELSFILQGNEKKAEPLTRARLVEIRYALWKAGIERPCMPL